MTNETWKPIKGYEGLYEVSDEGRVKSIKRNLIMKGGVDAKGYRHVNLTKDKRSITKKVHRLAWDSFNGLEDGMVINHKDKNRANNKLSNLEQVTQRENLSHGNKSGKTSKYTGVNLRRDTFNWRAEINIDGKVIKLGTYKEEIEAAKAYDRALDYYGIKNKYRNFPV